MKQLMVLLVLMFSMAAYSQAEGTRDKGKTARTERGRGEGREARFLEDFKELGLTEKQQNQLKVLFESERNNRQQNRQRFRGEEEERPSASEMKEMREQMKARAQVLDGKVKEILSEEQYMKWKEKREQRMKAFSER